MLTMIEERIRASDIRVEHRDALIRLRVMMKGDLIALGHRLINRIQMRAAASLTMAR